MNKIILLLVALFVVSTSGFALTNTKPADQQQKTSPVINLIIDLGDITDLNSSEIVALINKNLETSIPDLPKLQCSVTVGATFTVGFASFSVSVTVSGDCSEVRAEGTEIANQILADVKRYIQKHCR